METNYENSVQCKLVAVNCAVCARPLVDDISVETGVGPTCRKRHGYAEAQGEPNWPAVEETLQVMVADAPIMEALAKRQQQRLGNLIVHRIAVHQQGGVVPALIGALADLGFTKFSNILAKRVTTVEIGFEGDLITFRTPYEDDAIKALKDLRWKHRIRWDAQRKLNTIPVVNKPILWAWLRAHYAGHLGIVEKPETARVFYINA